MISGMLRVRAAPIADVFTEPVMATPIMPAE